MSVILTELGSIATAVGTFFANLFTSVSGLFYTPGTGASPGEITLFAYLILIAVAFSLAQWVIRLIMRMFRFSRS